MSVKFLRRETARGELRTVRLGRSVRVRPEDLRAYVAGRVTRPSQTGADSDA
ncbi:hypothetical protein EUA94_07330 [Nocardioides zhouii]|uniref:Helix-turn-helix domain-containing protein n=2 Tax=Nocardioides zhouii TaxID=1168729 RepID=A0A4Q2T1Z2_9ACTN|nr:hypothetical protein EUA94_07330 [Nocardioides zhouii]